MSHQFPYDFDDDDKAFAATIVPDGALVTGMVAAVGWMDGDGNFFWRCYNASQEGMRASEVVGLLEMAKMNILGRSDCGMPFNYDDCDEGDD